MSTNDSTLLRPWKLGIAANNLDIDADDPELLQVVPIEGTPFADGELVSLPFEAESTATDPDGNTVVSKVTMDQALPAKWLRGTSTNQATPPCIRRGMRVMLWRVGDENAYWWQDIGLDRQLMKLETVVMQFSATKDESADPRLPENSYYLEVSTHKGAITLSTSKANEEFCKYVVQINTKEGRIVVTDDIGNEMAMDSAETIIGFTNADGTQFELNKRDILGYAPEDIILAAEENMKLSCKTFELTCQNGTVNASSSFTIKTPTLTLDAGSTTATGTLGVDGNTTLNSQLAVSGTSRFSSAMTATGIRSSAPIVGPSDTI